MNYKKDLSEQNQKLLLKINVNVEDREYLAEEVEKNINDIGNYIISKSSKNGDINRAQLEYIPLINVLENYIEKKNKFVWGIVYGSFNSYSFNGNIRNFIYRI